MQGLFRTVTRVLEVPRAYQLFSNWVAGNGRETYVREYVRPVAGDRILDIGCGPADIVRELPHGVQYLGLDASSQYIDAARARFGDRATFECQAVSPALESRYCGYQIVMANGVLHHLDDTEALDALRLARAALGGNGRFVSLDGCYVPSQAAAARWLLHLDRGRHVRTPEEYLRLAQQVFGSVVHHLRHDLMRIPYTHLIMECSP